MKDLHTEVKVPNDQALAKELFQQVRDTKIMLETVLKRLNENRKLDECLGSKSAIEKPGCQSQENQSTKIHQTTTYSKSCNSKQYEVSDVWIRS